MRRRKIEAAMLLLVAIGLLGPVQLAARSRDGDRPRKAARNKGKLSESDLRKEYSKGIADLLSQQKFEQLEQQAVELLRDKPEFPSGRRKMEQFYSALGNPAKDTGDDAWKQLLELHRAWIKANPQSLTARLAQVNGYISYAWHARGGGYAETVTDEGGRLFDQRLHAAEECLDKAEKLPGKDPELYHARMGLGVALGYPRSRLDKLLRQALEIDPAWRGPIREMATFLLPRWYGKPGDLEKFADEAMESTKPQLGAYGYAVVVATAQSFHGAAVFEDFKFSWPKTRQGMDDAMKRYPHGEVMRNLYCYMACAAGDRAKAHELFELVDRDQPDLETWQSKQIFERWRHWSRPNLQQGGQRAVEEGHHEYIFAVGYLSDGTALLTGGGDGRVLFRDPKSAQKRLAVPLPGDFDAITSIAVAKESPLVAAATQQGGTFVWDVATKRTRTSRKVHGEISQVALSPDGKRLAAACRSGALVLWRLDRENDERVINDAHEREATGVQFSPDGKLLATCGGDGMIKLWDTATGKVQKQWRGHKPRAFALAFLPDGKRLASGGGDHYVKIWQVVDGKQVGSLADSPSSISCLAISADGQRLAAGTRAGPAWIKQSSAFVWDVGQEKLLGELKGHKSVITAIAISPDGTTIATTGYDMTVRLWNMPK